MWILSEQDALHVAGQEIWHSMKTAKGHPIGIYYDCRYLWFLRVIGE